MPTQTGQPFNIIEETSAELSWQFRDQNNAVVDNGALQTVTLTLYSIGGDPINGRDKQDILGASKTGANDVVITSQGAATWYMQPEDNAIVEGDSLEDHMALIEWSWNPGDGFGVRQGKQQIRIDVQNFARVP